MHRHIYLHALVNFFYYSRFATLEKVDVMCFFFLNGSLVSLWRVCLPLNVSKDNAEMTCPVQHYALRLGEIS